MSDKHVLVVGFGVCADRLSRSMGAPFVDALKETFSADLASALTAPLDLILFCASADIALRPLAFEAITEEVWAEGLHRPVEALMRTLHVLSDVYQASSPPPIVLAGPSMALMGGDQLVMLSAASEGQRALMKSAARQWGGRGFRFTWLALGSLFYAPELAGAPLPQSQDPEPIATGAPDAQMLSGLLSMLADPNGRGISGQTLVLDGGELMLP